MHAAALTRSAHAALLVELERAESAADFLACADAIVTAPDARFELATDLGVPEQLEVTSRRGGIDTENAISVHGFLGEMDRANAADPRLWCYLALVTFRSYMERRWPLGSDGKWRERARNRWLMANATRGRLIRHGIARLWWISHLTYDPLNRFPLTVSDKYGHTRAVFSNEDRILALFDRELGAIEPLVRAVLERAAAVGGSAAEDKPFRDLMRTLNAVQGYRDIGLIPSESMADFVRMTAEARGEYATGVSGRALMESGS